MSKSSFILPDGTIRSGTVPIANMLDKYYRLHLPDLTNKNVLHVNFDDGFNTIEMAKNGATVYCIANHHCDINTLNEIKSLYSLNNKIFVLDDINSILDIYKTEQIYDIIVIEDAFLDQRHLSVMFERITTYVKDLLVLECGVTSSTFSFPYFKFAINSYYYYTPNIQALFLIMEQNQLKNITIKNIQEERVILHANKEI